MNREKARLYVDAKVGAISEVSDSVRNDPETDSTKAEHVAAIATALVTLLEKSVDDSSDASIQIIGDCASWLGANGMQSLLVDLLNNLPRGMGSLKPMLYYSAGIAFKYANNPISAREMFTEARKYARQQQDHLLAIRSAIDLGGLAFDGADMRKARSWYEKAINEASMQHDYLLAAAAMNNLSTAYLDSEPSQASKWAKRSLEVKQTHGASEYSIMFSLGTLGIAMSKSGLHEEARELFEETLEIARKLNDRSFLARALLNVANEESVLGNYGKAKRLYRKALGLAEESDDIETKRLLQQAFAVNASRNGDYGQAERLFAELHLTWLSCDKRLDGAIALHDRALCLAKLKKNEEAQDLIVQAEAEFSELKDRDWQRRCLLLQAIELEAPGSDERIEVLRSATNIKGGEDKDLRLSSVRTLWQELLDRSDFAQAARELNREISWLSNDPEEGSERLHDAAMELLNRNRVAESEKRLRKAMSLLSLNDMSIPWMRQDLAIILARKDEYDEAIGLLRKNNELAKKQENRVLEMQSIGNIGELEREKGNPLKAIRFLETAVNLARSMNDLGEEAFWLNNLALALADNGDVSKARKTLQRAIRNASSVHDVSSEARAYGSRGLLDAKEGSFKSAVEQYDHAIMKALECKDNPFASGMTYNKAVALYHQGARDEALAEAEKALTLAHETSNNDLACDVGVSAAAWSIEWRRPTRAGSFLAAAFICSLLGETRKTTRVMGVFVIARQTFGAKQYEQFSRVVKREVSKSIKSDDASALIANVENAVNEHLFNDHTG